MHAQHALTQHAHHREHEKRNARTHAWSSIGRSATRADACTGACARSLNSACGLTVCARTHARGTACTLPYHIQVRVRLPTQMRRHIRIRTATIAAACACACACAFACSETSAYARARTDRHIRVYAYTRIRVYAYTLIRLYAAVRTRVMRHAEIAADACAYARSRFPRAAVCIGSYIQSLYTCGCLFVFPSSGA